MNYTDEYFKRLNRVVPNPDDEDPDNNWVTNPNACVQWPELTL